MESKFKCSYCDEQFDAKGKKVEYQSVIYEPCSKIIAECPKCSKEVNELILPKKGKQESGSNSGGCAGVCCCGKD